MDFWSNLQIVYSLVRGLVFVSQLTSELTSNDTTAAPSSNPTSSLPIIYILKHTIRLISTKKEEPETFHNNKEEVADRQYDKQEFLLNRSFPNDAVAKSKIVPFSFNEKRKILLIVAVRSADIFMDWMLLYRH